ncbi:MAG: CheY-like chemotaxis protein [Pseudohongiellaceae bacterium]|jgi:CheY-like chemotaxis protein
MPKRDDHPSPGHPENDGATQPELDLPAENSLNPEEIRRVLRDQQEEILSLRRERELHTRNLLASMQVECAGRMATGLSHDLSNLATCLKAHTTQLESQLHCSAQRESLSAIRVTADQTTELSRLLLALVPSQHNDEPIAHINRAVESLLPPLRRLIPEGIELAVELNSESRGVKASLSDLGLLLSQLVLNARDAITDNGVITISTQPGPETTVTVTDTGRGMDLSTAERAFEPYFTTKAHSTGLGLTALQQLVQKIGGSLAIDSAPDWGTSVTVQLPEVLANIPSPKKLTTASSPSEGTEAILVVDDDLGIASTTAMMLSSQGYAAQHVTEPTQVFELLRSDEPVDLILMDVVMSQWSGQAVAERCQLIRPGVKVLYISGYPATELKERSAIPDNEPLLQKPFTHSKLASMVRKVLDEPAPRPLPCTRVLLVSSDRAAQEASSASLTAAGLDVLRAQSGDEALAAIRAKRPQVMVCDLMMPGKDGLATCAEALQLHPKTQVIMVAEAGEGPLCTVMAKTVGAVLTLTQPVSQGRLLECVSELLAAGQMPRQEDRCFAPQ